jgi:hypothetical protein
VAETLLIRLDVRTDDADVYIGRTQVRSVPAIEPRREAVPIPHCEPTGISTDIREATEEV